MLNDNDKKLIEIFKSLSNDYWDFKDADTHELVHGIHTYPAIMIYPISRNIIKYVKSLTDVNSLLDPFAGSGTVLVEAMHSGIPYVYGNDINPLALLLSNVKTNIYDTNLLDSEITSLKKRIDDEYIKYEKIVRNVNFDLESEYDLSAKDGWGTDAPKILSNYLTKHSIELEIPKFKNIGYWFKPNVIMELQILKNCINKVENEEIKKCIYVAYSEIIRIVSNKRNGEFKMYRMTAEKVNKHNPNVKNEFEKTLERNINKVKEFSQLINNNNVKSNVTISNEDAAILNSVPNESIDLIITSPPYGDSRTTVAYGEFSRLSLQWMDLYDLSDKEILSIDKTLMGGEKYRKGYKYDLNSETLRKSLEVINKADIVRGGDVYSFYKDLEKIIKKCSEKTKKNGYQFWVVGNRTVKNELLNTDVIISEMASNYNMEYIYTIDRIISNKVMPSKNSPTNISGQTVATMCNEHIVVLRKK